MFWFHPTRSDSRSTSGARLRSKRAGGSVGSQGNGCAINRRPPPLQASLAHVRIVGRALPVSLTCGALPIIERAHRRDTSTPSTVTKATEPLPLIQVLLPHLRVRRGVPETAKRVVKLTRLVVLSRGSGRASGRFWGWRPCPRVYHWSASPRSTAAFEQLDRLCS